MREREEPPPPAALRTHTISVRVNGAERAELERRRAAAGLREMGAYLRAAVLGQRPPRAVVPEINRCAWQELARTAANVNQLTAHLNGGGRLDATGTVRMAVVLEDLRREVEALRLALLGSPEDAEDENA
jgi:hypothetical protein